MTHELGKLDDVSFVCSSLRCVLKVYRLRILRGNYDDIIESTFPGRVSPLKRLVAERDLSQSGTVMGAVTSR